MKAVNKGLEGHAHPCCLVRIFTGCIYRVVTSAKSSSQFKFQHPLNGYFLVLAMSSCPDFSMCEYTLVVLKFTQRVVKYVKITPLCNVSFQCVKEIFSVYFKQIWKFIQEE